MEKKLSKKIGINRQKAQKQINNVIIWSEITIKALNQTKENEDFLKSKKFKVPSTCKGRSVRRSVRDITQIFNDALDYQFFYAIIAYLVAQVEAFMSDTIRLVLNFDPRRLKTKIQGIDHVKKINVDEIVDASCREKILSNIIDKELLNIFYSCPKAQIDYFKKVLGVNLDQEIMNRWIEIKATRDIIVHNNGIINDIYIMKAGDKCRGSRGDRIIVNKKYFESSATIMKQIVGKISTQLQKEFK